MVKPGKHSFIVKYPQDKEEDDFDDDNSSLNFGGFSASETENAKNAFKFSYHTCIVSPRDQPIPHSQKRNRHAE